MLYFHFITYFCFFYHPHSKMKLVLRIGLFLTLFGILAFLKFKYFPRENTIGTPPAPASAGKPNAVVTGVSGYIVKSEKLDNKIFSTGSIVANEIVDIKPELAGKIIALNFSEGKPVKKGQMLIKLNDADYQAQLDKSRAQLNVVQQTEIRLRKLLDIKGVSQDEYDAAVLQINNIKADMQYIQTQIDKTEIKAPFNGVIGLKNVSVGSYINSLSQIATIQMLNPVKIDFTIPEKYVNQVKIGETLTFQSDASTQNYFGKVYATENQIDPIARTLKLRATAENPNFILKPGAFVKVNFSLKEIDNALMVPTEAIVPILKGQQVYISKNGKAQALNVEVGVRTDTKIQIMNGVHAGDTIITSGLMSIKPDMPVKFTKIL